MVDGVRFEDGALTEIQAIGGRWFHTFSAGPETTASETTGSTLTRAGADGAAHALSEGQALNAASSWRGGFQHPHCAPLLITGRQLEHWAHRLRCPATWRVVSILRRYFAGNG